MIPVLETKRLILKLPEMSDLEDLLILRTDPEVMQYIGNGSVQNEKQVKDFLDKAIPYFEEQGLAFYSVFEKETGHFVGQAGLFHLGFDVTQPAIELAYRLNKKYWYKGYATELAKALIDYGFNQLSLPKIVAVVHPANERSRRVMEKAGMFYSGIIEYKEMKLPCYEILNSKLDFTKVTLIPASIKELPIIQNMARFYVYDMSEFMGKEEGWEIPENGLYECIDFQSYWEDDTSYPFIIRCQNEIAGFAVIDKKGSAADTDFNMAQFFILRKFKNKGLGRYIAKQCFEKFSGKWEVMVIPGNEGAYRFWRATIKNYTNNNFTEHTRKIAQSDNNSRNIFEFNSLNERGK